MHNMRVGGASLAQRCWLALAIQTRTAFRPSLALCTGPILPFSFLSVKGLLP